MLHRLPHRLRDVRARRRGALLALVFECAANQRRPQSVSVRRLVRHHKVLAPCLTHKSWVGPVAVDVLADLAPHVLENLSRAGEVDARQLAVMQHLLRDLCRAAAHHVDDAGRHARLEEKLHQEMADQQRLRRRLEHHRVAHEHRRGRKVASDGGEIEGADREDETLERPILEAVPRGAVVGRLLLVDPQHELDVEAEEISQLARCIDLCLMSGLGLAEHGRRVDRIAPWTGEQGGRAQQDRRTLLERGRRPHLSRRESGADRVVDVLGASDCVLRDRQLVPVRGTDVAPRRAPAPLAADLHRDLSACVGQLRQAGLQALAMRVARGVRANGLVGGLGDLEMSVGGHLPSSAG